MAKQFDSIKYKNKKYPLRNIHLKNCEEKGYSETETLVIGPQSLNEELEKILRDREQERLLTKEFNYAYEVDSTIFGYVPDELLEKTDEEIETFIIKNLI